MAMFEPIYENIFIATGELVPYDQYYRKIRIPEVKKLVQTIGKLIGANEQRFDDELGTRIFVSDDIVFCFPRIARWRRGTAYVVLQISAKNKGTARITMYVTNTIHHHATSFGTTPDIGHANDIRREYLADRDTVIGDLTRLCATHPTRVRADELYDMIGA
jgi:hypothetical protein